MDLQIATSLAGGVSLLFAAISALCSFYKPADRWVLVLRLGCVMALLMNAIYFALSIQEMGLLASFSENFESTLLLASLIALVGLGVHLSPSLRGLDGFLFIVAVVTQFGALAVRSNGEEVVAGAPWFMSHGLTFVVSGACFVAGGAAGIAYLILNRALRKKQTSLLAGGVVPLEALERFWRFMLVVGFPLFTYGVLTGFCGIFHEMGPDKPSFAQWMSDPFLIVSLITWFVYAYLFMSLLFRVSIRGARAARLTTAGMAMVVIVFVFAFLISPLHR